MSVGGIRGGGGRGGPKGPRGVSGKGASVGGARGKSFGKTDRTEKAAGPSGLAGSANVQGADPVMAEVMTIARMYKSGEMASREEATKRVVSSILKEKLRMRSKALTAKISTALEDDPRLSHTLDRLLGQDAQDDQAP